MPPSRRGKEKPIDSLQGAFSELGSNLQRIAVSPDVNSYKPHNKQVMFHTSDHYTRLYIGGNRSGKTTGGIVEDIWWLTGKHPYMETPNPSIRPVMGRLVSVDFINGIKKIIIPQLKQWIPPSQLFGGSWFTAYSESERVLTLENNSQLELMSYDQDLDKFAGTSRDFIHFDEEPPYDIYNECKMRLIDRKGRLWITMTPVEGMTWMHDDVYEPGILGDKNIKIIEVDMHENPHIDPEEIERATAGLSEEEKQARIEGKFVQMGGLIYKKFKVATHVIPQVDFREFLDTKKYKIYMSLDHGLNNPTSVHWHAVDNDGNVITFDEHYEAGRIIEYHAAVIHSRNALHGRMPDVNVADPALAQRSAITGTSIFTEYAIRGIGLLPANNDVRTGIAKVAEYTTPNANGVPTWHITENCSRLIWEIQRYRWKTWASKKQQHANNPYEEPHKKDDHAMDDCRYFFTLMPSLSWVHEEDPKQNLTEFMRNAGAQIGSKGMADPWIRIDPNLTPVALSQRAAQNEQSIWREVLNEEIY